MNLKAFKKPSSKSDEVTQLGIAVEDYTQQLATNPMLAGVLITGIKVGPAAVNIVNPLNVAPRGWIVTRRLANSNVWEVKSNQFYLTLTASVADTVDVWIF